MKNRIITALALVVVAVFCLFFGIITFKALVFIAGAIAIIELYQVTLYKRLIYVPIVSFIALLIITNSEIIMQNVILGVYAFFLVTAAILDEAFHLKEATIHFVVVFLLGNALHAGVSFYKAFGPMAIAWIFLVNYSTDTGAYLVGSEFGKHKLNERVSKNKTIEGSVGGWILAALIGVVTGPLLLNGSSTNFILSASLLIPIFAQIGDLFFSLIKREYGVKDFGSIFPGHGGMVDRIDSLVFALFVSNILMLVWSWL